MSKKETKSTSIIIPLEWHKKLEAYAWGTRRRFADVMREALEEYLENHEEEIKNKSVF